LLTPGIITTPQQQAVASNEEIKDTTDKTTALKTSNVSKGRNPSTAPKKADQKKVIAQKINPDNSTVEKEKSPLDLGAYKVRSKAYFHNEPDEATRRNAFIVHWNNAVLHPLKDENGFVYVVFTNDEGQTSKGWLRKKDLIKL
jgi:serine/threonine-protein kinase